jgi:hypothetical protein
VGELATQCRRISDLTFLSLIDAAALVLAVELCMHILPTCATCMLCYKGGDKRCEFSVLILPYMRPSQDCRLMRMSNSAPR